MDLVKSDLPQGLTSKVTIDLAAGFVLPAFFAAYSARRSSRIRACSASSSSSSEPKRSTSSSSSSSSALVAALAGLTVSRLGTVGSELLGGVAGKRREFRLERGDVLVPTGSVGVLGSLGLRLQGLEGLDIGLGWGVALKSVSLKSSFSKSSGSDEIVAGAKYQCCDKRIVFESCSGVLSRLINTDQFCYIL
jgi:hypothetical protein